MARDFSGNNAPVFPAGGRFETVWWKTCHTGPTPPAYPGAGQHPDIATDLDQTHVSDVPAVIYRSIWRLLDLDNVPQPLDSAIFNLAMHCGIKAAVTALQNALNRMVLHAGDLTVDGVLGRQTVARIFMATRKPHGIEDLTVKFRQNAAAHYVDLIRADSALVIHQANWLKQAEGLGRD